MRNDSRLLSILHSPAISWVGKVLLFTIRGAFDASGGAQDVDGIVAQVVFGIEF